MEKGKTRRGFIGLLGAAGLALVTLAERREASAVIPQFQGTSRKGSFEEALQRAIAAAEKGKTHPDILVEWKIVSIAGRSGGIAGFQEMTVTIQAKVD